MFARIARLFSKPHEVVPDRDVAALVAPLALPALRVATTDAATRSRFGGDPDLPPGFAWPERNGAKLAFLARLSLAELHETGRIDWLPETGALLFFYDVTEQPWGYDPQHRGGAMVLLVPESADTPPAHRGWEPTHGDAPLACRNIAFERIDSMPSAFHRVVEPLGLSDTECELVHELHDESLGNGPLHQVAGYPSPVQDDGMELQCQLVTHDLFCGDSSAYADPRAAALAPGASNWKLLFQIDSDEELGAAWGDGGTLYYWVEEARARGGDFGNAWLILQCS